MTTFITCVARSFPNKGSSIAFGTALWDQLDATVLAGETCRDYYGCQKGLYANT